MNDHARRNDNRRIFFRDKSESAEETAKMRKEETPDPGNDHADHLLRLNTLRGTPRVA